MLIRCGLLLLCLNCVRTTEYFVSDGNRVAEFNRRFSLWPSVHNAARLLRLRREAEVGEVLQSEGGSDVLPPVDKNPLSGAVNPPSVEAKNASKNITAETVLPTTILGGKITQ